MLAPAPSTALDPATGRPRFGSYVGEVVDDAIASLEPSWVRRVATHKRWIYLCTVADGVFVAMAVVDLGYACNAFALAYRASEGVLFDRSFVGLPGMGAVTRDEHRRVHARFRHPKARFVVDWPRDRSTLQAEATFGSIAVQLRLDGDAAPPPLTAIAAIEGGRVNVTEKRALQPTQGTLRIGDRELSLNEGLGGIDYTHGLLARHTAWRWAFLLGTTTTGMAIGMNLVEGFVGEPECGLFVGRRVLPLREGRFTWRHDDPMQPWRVTTADGAVDLTFTPGGMHAERRNLGIVRSRFVQPMGSFAGTIRVEDEVHEIGRALGVVEDQDVHW